MSQVRRAVQLISVDENKCKNQLIVELKLE
jgi:hypothetical protein